MFRSNWTILRERMLSLAKATILWNWSVKIHLYMICGVVATSISGCDVFTACRVVCDCSFLCFLWGGNWIFTEFSCKWFYFIVRSEIVSDLRLSQASWDVKLCRWVTSKRRTPLPCNTVSSAEDRILVDTAAAINRIFILTQDGSSQSFLHQRRAKRNVAAGSETSPLCALWLSMSSDYAFANIWHTGM
jgi:hypothetical protein